MGRRFFNRIGGKRALEELLAEHPDFAQTRFNLGLLLLLHGNKEEGLRHARKAVRLEPAWGPKLDKIPDKILSGNTSRIF